MWTCLNLGSRASNALAEVRPMATLSMGDVDTPIVYETRPNLLGVT